MDTAALVRATEHAKYVRAYEAKNYQMGGTRYSDALNELRAVAELAGTDEWSLLDVGCGRGEMIKCAFDLRFLPVYGTEVVPGLCRGSVTYGEITNLPFADEDFDVVTCFDVLEHIPPQDTVLALLELNRVARRVILASANNKPSTLPDGTNLHVNKRPYENWDALMRAHWPGIVEQRKTEYVSETWRCIKA